MLGSLTAGLGLAAPFAIYGVALLVAAAVVFVNLRHSALAAPAEDTEAPVTLRIALRHKAYRSALFSNFATGWSVFGLRIALVPLFVTEVLHRGPRIAGLALATFAVGNVAAVIPSGYLSDRIGRRNLLIVGLTVSGVATVAVGLASSLTLFLAGALVAGAAAGMFTSPQQAAVADIIGSKARGGTAVATYQMMADVGAIVGLTRGRRDRPARVVRRGLRDQRRDSAGRGGRLGIRTGDPAAALPSRPLPARSAPRSVANCPDQLF